MVETADASFTNGCIHGHWFLQVPNGMTTPGAPDVPKTNTARVSPSSLPSDTLDPSSKYAIHVSGSGQRAGGYAYLFASLNELSDSETDTVDASAFTGIQFYAIINAPSEVGLTGVRFAIGDLDTDMSYGHCTPTSGPMTCGDRLGRR